MTRSIFDPAGGNTERSGSVFTPPDAEQISHLPPDLANADLLRETEAADTPDEGSATPEAVPPAANADEP